MLAPCCSHCRPSPFNRAPLVHGVAAGGAASTCWCSPSHLSTSPYPCIPCSGSRLTSHTRNRPREVAQHHVPPHARRAGRHDRTRQGTVRVRAYQQHRCVLKKELGRLLLLDTAVWFLLECACDSSSCALAALKVHLVIPSELTVLRARWWGTFSLPTSPPLSKFATPADLTRLARVFLHRFSKH